MSVKNTQFRLKSNHSGNHLNIKYMYLIFERWLHFMEISNCCGCRPRCPQSVYAPAPNFGYNVQHPVMVPNEPNHYVGFHPEYWQWPQAGQMPVGVPGVGVPGVGFPNV